MYFLVYSLHYIYFWEKDARITDLGIIINIIGLFWQCRFESLRCFISFLILYFNKYRNKKVYFFVCVRRKREQIRFWKKKSIINKYWTKK